MLDNGYVFNVGIFNFFNFFHVFGGLYPVLMLEYLSDMGSSSKMKSWSYIGWSSTTLHNFLIATFIICFVPS